MILLKELQDSIEVSNENDFSVSYRDLNSLGAIDESQSTTCEDNCYTSTTYIPLYSSMWTKQSSTTFTLPKKIKETFYKNFNCNIRLSTRFVNNKYEICVFQTNGNNIVFHQTEIKKEALWMHTIFDSCKAYLDDDDFINAFLDLLYEGQTI